MSYNEFTNSRVKLEQLHAEAAQVRLVRVAHRQRITGWLRRMANAIEHE